MSDIISTIRDSFNTLKNAERRVAEVVLRDAHQVMSYSITELAEKANTSEPTVVRVCRKIGLKGYMELRLNLARDLPSAQYIHENVSETDSTIQTVGKLFSSFQDALNETLNNLDIEVFNAAVETLAAADRIEFYGVGGSAVVAKDAHHKFFRLEVPCIAYADPHMQAMSASLLTPDSAVVVFSVSGATKDLIESVNIAKESGATTIGIVGRIISPLARCCDHVLSVHSQEAALRLAPMSSRLAQLALSDSLFVAVAIRKAGATKTRLGKVKRSLIDKRH